jgi:hypothetical protein
MSKASKIADQLDLVEDDDEFEEFEDENVPADGVANVDAEYWDDTWDDEDVDAEFAAALKKDIEIELRKQTAK